MTDGRTYVHTHYIMTLHLSTHLKRCKNVTVHCALHLRHNGMGRTIETLPHGKQVLAMPSQLPCMWEANMDVSNMLYEKVVNVKTNLIYNVYEIINS